MSTDQIQRLIAGFRANLAALRDPQTLEAVIRSEYLDPFWKALGWDVANCAHRTQAEKDVVVEPPVDDPARECDSALVTPARR